MNKWELLNRAGAVIEGERARDYGDADENFSRIAVGWSVIAESAMNDHGEIRREHVALMMDWLKTCRLLGELGHEDSWIDKLGYTALGGEIADKGKAFALSPEEEVYR